MFQSCFPRITPDDILKFSMLKRCSLQFCHLATELLIRDSRNFPLFDWLLLLLCMRYLFDFQREKKNSYWNFVSFTTHTLPNVRSSLETLTRILEKRETAAVKKNTRPISRVYTERVSKWRSDWLRKRRKQNLSIAEWKLMIHVNMVCLLPSFCRFEIRWKKTKNKLRKEKKSGWIRACGFRSPFFHFFLL